jgi:hypothetical protein
MLEIEPIESEELNDQDTRMHNQSATSYNIWYYRRLLRWGVTQKNGGHKTFFLYQLSTEHLANILKTQGQCTPLCKGVIAKLIAERTDKTVRKAMQLPFEELPTYINDPDYTVQEVVRKRLARAK